jgi:hypothetical protein
MGNKQFEVPNHIKEDWEEISWNGKQVLRNKSSSEVFEFLVLSKLH